MRTTDPGDAARIELLIAELRLPAIKQVWPSLAAQADKEDWPAGRFLAALAEHEVAERSRRRLERHLAEARLPPGKTLDTFDFEVVPVVSKAQVRALAAGDAWLSNGADLVLFGPPGGGKIHVAAAFGFALVESGWRVLFTRTTDLVQRLQLARRELALEGAIAKLDKIHLLILDDLAYLTSGFDRPPAGPASGPTLPSIPEWEIMTSQIAGHRGTVSLWPILILVFYVRPPAKPAKLAPILEKLWDFRDIRWHVSWLSDPPSASQRAPRTGLAPLEGKFRSTGSMTVAANNRQRIAWPDPAVQPQQPGKLR